MVIFGDTVLYSLVSWRLHSTGVKLFNAGVLDLGYTFDNLETLGKYYFVMPGPLPEILILGILGEAWVSAFIKSSSDNSSGQLGLVATDLLLPIKGIHKRMGHLSKDYTLTVEFGHCGFWIKEIVWSVELKALSITPQFTLCSNWKFCWRGPVWTKARVVPKLSDQNSPCILTVDYALAIVTTY